MFTRDVDVLRMQLVVKTTNCILSTSTSLVNIPQLILHNQHDANAGSYHTVSKKLCIVHCLKLDLAGDKSYKVHCSHRLHPLFVASHDSLGSVCFVFALFFSLLLSCFCCFLSSCFPVLMNLVEMLEPKLDFFWSKKYLSRCLMYNFFTGYRL